MMRGIATIVTQHDDRSQRKRTVDRKVVWNFLGLVPLAVELRARHLQWYRSLMDDPQSHQNVLLALFSGATFESESTFDENGRVRDGACGGARLWQRTLTFLQCVMMEPFFSRRAAVQ